MVCRERKLEMAGEKRKMAEIQGNSNEMMKSLSDLPSDLLSLIKSRLFAGDYGAFNAVCSYWRSITILVRQPPPPMDSPFRYQPWLMLIQRGNGMTMLSHPLYNGFYCIDIPQLYNAKILYSKYGWLLMIVNFRMFFFNPFTREKIELPDTAHDFTSVCFNLPPTSKDCLVIGFFCGAWPTIGLLRRGQQNWDTYEYESCFGFLHGSSSPVLFKGMYYVLGLRGNIGVFDLKNQSWEIFGEPFEPEFVDSLCQSYLLELDGELVAVFFSLDNQVYFYSLDLTEMVWHSRTSTGDNKLLYVSCTSAFSRRATVKGMSNKIYFPIFSGKNSVFYSLRTKRFHSFDADHPNKMRELRLSTWIEPSFEHHGQLIW